MVKVLGIILIAVTSDFCYCLSVSYNRPEFCSNATWNQHPEIFANSSTIGKESVGIFIDINNTVYATSYSLNLVKVWLENSIIPTRTISDGLQQPLAVFVTVTGNIYVDNGENKRVDMWAFNTNKSVPVLNVSDHCFGLFIDISDTLYCSLHSSHQIVKRSLNSDSTVPVIAAGTGSAGSELDQLDEPIGIFVDTNFNLYVADCRNNRIQRFSPGQPRGITVAGNGASGSIILNCPRGIILDGYDYLFIVDDSRRIIRSGPNGFQCIAGCSDTNILTPSQIWSLRRLAFDSYGNIFATDWIDSCILKFIFATNSCDPHISNLMETTITERTSTEQRPPVSSSTTQISPVSSSTTQISPVSSSTSSSLPISPTSNINQDCYLSIISLIPSSPSLLTLKQFRRSEDFYIRSNLRFNCTQSFSILIQWTILTYLNQTKFCPVIKTTESELFIQARTLSYGIYELQLTVTMIEPFMSSSSSIYIEIIPSKIIANLILFGTSEITHDYGQDLILDPGTFSIDPDEFNFNPNNWNYTYYYRLNQQEEFKLLEDSKLSMTNIIFTNILLVFYEYIGSSLRIFSKSLTFNQSYEFKVQMIDRRNISNQASAYLLVHVNNFNHSLIIISCVISTICSSNGEYQYISRNNQLSLYSSCISNENLIWKIYQGSINSSTNIIQWTQFNSSIHHLVYGLNTPNLTVFKELFIDIIYWRFQLIRSDQSFSTFNFEINPGPENGNCSIEPRIGTTTTLFTISCFNWTDKHEIKDYLIYLFMKNSSKKLFIGFTIESIFQARLPSDIDHIQIIIRDKLNSFTEYNLSSVIVLPDDRTMKEIIDILQETTFYLNSHLFMQLLIIGDQNIIYSILFFLNDQSLNSNANARESLMMFVSNLPITNSESIQLQGSILSLLTQTTNQLTRETLILAANKCSELTRSLESMSRTISYEDMQLTATYILESVTNILTGINSPLQDRVDILNRDLMRANAMPDDYEDLTFSEYDDSFKGRNTYYQKQTAKIISKQMMEVISSITDIFDIHLNMNQCIIINSDPVFFSLEKTIVSSLSNRDIQLVGNARIHLPSIFNSTLNNNDIVLLRSMIEPLASAGNSQFPSYTSFSRLISFSILNQHGNEVHIETTFDDPIELIIPRDPTLPIPLMFEQNVTLINENENNLLFNLHFIDFKQYSNISFHFEMQSSDFNLSYLFIYKFDNNIPQLTDTINQIDGWTLFCRSNLTQDGLYTYFIDNQHLLNHHSIIIGIRELDLTEVKEYCLNSTSYSNPPITNKPFYFSSNYKLRTYLSTCYYLHSNNDWQSNGLRVGSSTNLNETQCYSTHLTTLF